MNKIVNNCRVGIVVFLIVLLNLGCSVTHSVSTSSTVSLSKELKKEIPAIKYIKYTFTRPDLTINIKMNDAPTEESINFILANVKQFSLLKT